MAVASYILDTNILLRFLTNDDEINSPACAALINAAGSGEFILEVPFCVVSETVYTLSSFYKIPPIEIAPMMLSLFCLKGMRLTGPTWTLAAIEEFGQGNHGFGDICVAMEARNGRRTLITLDTDFEKFKDVQSLKPSQLIENG